MLVMKGRENGHEKDRKSGHEQRHMGIANVCRPLLASVLVIVMLCTGVISQDSSEYTFKTRTELVLVNVTVRDKNGNPVRDLKREDFTILEDNKSQQVVSFDLENTDDVLSTAAQRRRCLVLLKRRRSAQRRRSKPGP